MDELLNLSLSCIQNPLDESEEELEEEQEDEEWDEEWEEEAEEEESEESEDEVVFEDGSRLLYYFSQIFHFLSTNIFMTTYVEQKDSEYFAGFSNLHFVCPIREDRQVKRHRFCHLTVCFHAFRSSTSA
ncbi:APC membrane recruitment protein 1 [Drosophila biarmipes]|uniref:APC membrane recruitment protein 1 n=1 Tax=Drosophila biarmipes TaxID=125945 RepID=UPI0007E740E3|nr:APC membrane recruitment protein 1 [Drosophila biarmipes]